jgi:hypothetical protein
VVDRFDSLFVAGVVYYYWVLAWEISLIVRLLRHYHLCYRTMHCNAIVYCQYSERGIHSGSW